MRGRFRRLSSYRSRFGRRLRARFRRISRRKFFRIPRGGYG